jgi:hypothetical protein
MYRSGVLAGRRSVKTEPLPRVLAAETAPGCASASLRKIGRPSPLPAVCRLRDFSARQKAVKDPGRSSAAIPVPVSATSTSLKEACRENDETPEPDGPWACC